MKRFINNPFFLILVLLVSGIAVKAQVQELSRSAKAENKVAVLPIAYIGNGSEVKIEGMKYRLQNIAYLYLKEEAMELKFQDPTETNALLLKHGVNESNFREFTPHELADILHVEYVLTGFVTQEYTGEAGVSNSNSRWYNRNDRRGKRETEHFVTREQMNTHIDLAIYNDKGETIFSKSRRSILTDVDAYKNGIQYLLKRSPLYKR